MGKVFFFCVLFGIWTISDAEYRVAVIEHNSVDQSTPALTIEKNLVDYVNSIEFAKKNSAKMVVFPEYGLTDLVQDPEDYAIELPPLYTSNFSASDDTLLRLSNTAKEHAVYLVVNLLERERDSSNKSTFYNTNIVFAKNGTLITKYRKINLQNEPKLTPGKDVVTFDTDFGRFGLMTGIDILNYKPSQWFGFSKNVTNVAYPTAWQSSMPFYMAMEVQAGYVLANKVNLLAAGFNEPSKGYGGSAIYQDDGDVINSFITDKPATSNVISTVDSASDFTLSGFDIIDGETVSPLSNFNNSRDFDSKAYTFKSIELSGADISDSVCHKKICCSFNIVALSNETNSSEIYKIMAYNGKATLNSKSVTLQLCSLLACSSNDISTCGTRPSTSYQTKFRHISVRSNFTLSGSDALYRPMTITGALKSVYNVTYKDTVYKAAHDITLNTTRTTDNLILFGIYGKGAGEIMHISMFLILLTVFLQSLF
ncbi:vanin-like protein 1 isoform X2 [Rhynchophorus ferrugineus]|uniref:vanin-like protein 1 isoform X2 n=1 Tax=Rhynchophorus ferrugineus TaxID=354439 RepID=UPI003FCD1475